MKFTSNLHKQITSLLYVKDLKHNKFYTRTDTTKFIYSIIDKLNINFHDYNSSSKYEYFIVFDIEKSTTEIISLYKDNDNFTFREVQINLYLSD